VLAPDWPLITWTEAERAKGQAWGLQTIESQLGQAPCPCADNRPPTGCPRG
jgi:hypothetical protein